MNDPLLSIEDLTIQYETVDGELTAVSNASIDVHRGEYYGLVGESGCGKSTIAKAIMGGLDENGTVTSGTIRYDGREIQDYSDRELNEHIRWKEISWIPQGSMDSLDPLQRISEQAWEIAHTQTDLGKEEALDKFTRMFETVGLPPERIDDYPHQLSGGMQQRAIIAMALFLEPKLIIADEPTTALDVIMQDMLFMYLDKIREEMSTSMILITHDISLVFETCDSMAVMHAGQPAETGDVKHLYDSPRHPYLIQLQKAFPDIRYPDADLHIIQGNPPQNTNEADYCRFVDRCPWAEDQCRAEEPTLESVEEATEDTPAHNVACFRKEEIYQDDLADLEGTQ